MGVLGCGVWHLRCQGTRCSRPKGDSEREQPRGGFSWASAALILNGLFKAGVVMSSRRLHFIDSGFDVAFTAKLWVKA